MRILITVDPEIPVPCESYGGIQRIAASLMQRLSEYGHEVALAAHPDSTQRCSYLIRWGGLSSQDYRASAINCAIIAKAALKFRPAIIHSFARMLYLISTLPLKKTAKIMSYQRHPGRRQIRQACAISRGSLHFTACSNYIRALGEPAGGAWRTIYNFVDLNSYSASPCVPPDAPLLFLSRIEKIKGTHTAIEIARKAERKLIIAGNIPSEPAAEAYFKDHIQPLIDGSSIQYVGPVNDREKNSLLGSAAALLVPIEWDEPFGIVFAEALACGTPVIATPRGAVPEIVRHGREGFTPSNVAQAVTAVHALPQINRLHCRQRAEELFSADVVIPQYMELYDYLSHSR